MKLSRLQIRKLILESLNESFPQLFRNPKDPDETEVGTRDLKQALDSADMTDPQAGTVPYRPPVSFSRKEAAQPRFEDGDNILDPFSDEAASIFGSPEERRETVTSNADAFLRAIAAEQEEEARIRKEYQQKLRDRQKLLSQYIGDDSETAEKTFDTDVLPAEVESTEVKTEVEPTMTLQESLSRGSLIRRRWGRY